MNCSHVSSTLDALITAALAEDVGSGDVTTRATIAHDVQARACIAAKADGVIAGLDIARAVFARVDATLAWKSCADADGVLVCDGAHVESGAQLATIFGSAASILIAERTALNFLQRLSGIATLTKKFVDVVRGTRAQILDTRKTTPGWRALEKYAVVCGGGANHRAGLWDRYLVKNNHIDLCGGVTNALTKVFADRDVLESCDVKKVDAQKLLIEVEVRDTVELRAALAFPVDIILLDNFSPTHAREAIALINGRAQSEISGGITLENVRTYAETGADFISVGALTHSATALDLHLRVETL